MMNNKIDKIFDKVWKEFEFDNPKQMYSVLKIKLALDELKSEIEQKIKKLEKEANYKKCHGCDTKKVIVYRDKYGRFFCKECMKTIHPSSEGEILGVWLGLINHITECEEQLEQLKNQLKQQPKQIKKRIEFHKQFLSPNHTPVTRRKSKLIVEELQALLPKDKVNK